MKQGETVDKRDGNSGIMTPMLGLKGKNCTFYDGKIWNYNQSINQYKWTHRHTQMQIMSDHCYILDLNRLKNKTTLD